MRFNVTEQCLKNRGLNGAAQFIAMNFLDMIKKTIEREGVGSYEITFKKVSIKPNLDDGHTPQLVKILNDPNSEGR